MQVVQILVHRPYGFAAYHSPLQLCGVYLDFVLAHFRYDLNLTAFTVYHTFSLSAFVVLDNGGMDSRCGCLKACEDGRFILLFDSPDP